MILQKLKSDAEAYLGGPVSEAVITVPGENYLRYLTDDEFSVLQKTESYEDEYTDMWKTFFHSISIEQRKNYVCQRNLFPIWKRKHAVEFR